MDPPDAATRNYYNAPSTNSFYQSFWGGGEHIHIGTYTATSDTIELASQRTVERMAALISSPPITLNMRILDVGAGYGGAARWLASQYGCHVTCLNLSEVQNERNRERCREQGLEGRVEVVDGSFEKMPFADQSFDLVWCQDCLLHASDRSAAVKEIARVLVDAQNGAAQLVLTDHMAAENADPEKFLMPIKKRLMLTEDLASRDWYQNALLENGFKDVEFIDGTENMVMHGRKVIEALQQCTTSEIPGEAIKNAKKGMSYWVEGGEQGFLKWGIFHCRR